MQIVTYNIQWGKGQDEVVDLSRIARTVAKAITLTAGTIRRIRRTQKPAKEKRPSRRFLRRIPVMRKPEMTKKTSTPTNPPPKRSSA